MATVLLAIGDGALRAACLAQLEAAGHAPLLLDRPLALLTLAPKLGWDVVCLDASRLGRETLKTLSDDGLARGPIVGIGLETEGLQASIALPLAAERLLSTLAGLLAPTEVERPSASLRLDADRRMALANDVEVALTRTEFRLLTLLLGEQPRDVSLPEVLRGVWGFTEGRGTSELVRAHVRNLRTKLAQIGLPDAVRSRRGRGYALTV